jgi:hypothetical protein
MQLPKDVPGPKTLKGAKMGSLGCLGRVLLYFALAAAALLAADAVFAPWGFYMGGNFHIFPVWRGWGRMHSKVSGDYVLFVRFEPSPNRGSRIIPGSSLTGVGYLCTPRGERFRLNLGGGMRAHLNRSTDGEAIHLYMSNRSALYGQFTGENRPHLDLRGHWQNPMLVMSDGGSISREFLPDGRVYHGHDTGRPYASEIVPLTLNQGSYSEFEAACAPAHP